MNTDKTARIRALNDRLRQTGCGGQLMGTQGLMGRGPAFVKAALAQVSAFTDFAHGDDPYCEHDFGAFEVQGERLFWKIDYYDLTLTAGAEDSSDPRTCRRVLTVMLAGEY